MNAATSIRAVIVVLALLLAVLQARLWFSEDGYREVARLRAEIGEQRQENEHLAGRNERLAAEVEDLGEGFAALEERARADLGLVGPGESFFVVGGEDPAESEEAE